MSQELVSAAILKTLIYHDLFAYPLTPEEIYRWLISPQRISQDNFLTTLGQMVGKKLVETYRGEYFFLPGRQEIVTTRQNRQLSSLKKKQRAKILSWLARIIPWIKLVGISGALSMENSDENDDIDWVIITSPHRLWISRACLVSLLLIFGQYRRPTKIKDRICPNVWLTLDNLKFPDSQRNLFLAHEIAQMRPLWSRNYTYEGFLKENGWVDKFLVNFYQTQKPERKNPSPSSQFKPERRIPIISLAIDDLDSLFEIGQRSLMAKKVTTETIGEGILKLHPQDVSSRILMAYQQKVDSLLS
ncbi:MAG: hypothetical protein Q8N84_02855 [bacterium]|nr:hypothetical protein [bacterium]